MKTIGKIIILLLAIIFVYSCSGPKQPAADNLPQIHLGVSPDEAGMIAMLAVEKGLDHVNGIDMQVSVFDNNLHKPLIDGNINACLQSMNQFMMAYNKSVEKNNEIVFYNPLYIDKGYTLLANKNSGLKSFEDIERMIQPREKAWSSTIWQLKGKKMSISPKTLSEQFLKKLFLKTEITESDITVLYQEADKGFKAFMDGKTDLYFANEAQAVTAMKEGHIALFRNETLSMEIISGISTTREYAINNDSTLKGLINTWYSCIEYINKNQPVSYDELAKKMSATMESDYTSKDIENSFKQNKLFPMDYVELNRIVLKNNSEFFWKKVWNENNSFLSSMNIIPSKLPRNAFQMEDAKVVVLIKQPKNK